jgi:replicative DNA helicase
MADNKLFTLDSEVAVLSSLLQHPNLIHSIDGLRFYMFSSTPNQNLFKEMEELKEKQYVPDPSLVVSSLKAKNELDQVGGEKQIEFLLSKNVNEDAIEKFVELVVASYKARSLVSVTSSVHKDDLNSENIDEEIHRMKKSLDALLEMRTSAGAFHVGDVTREAYEEIISRRSNPGIRGNSWGVKDLDNATGGKSGGDLWVIGGRPGHGKTALICNSVLQDGLAGIPSLLIEREMRTQELVERLISIDTGIPNSNIRLGVIDNKQIEQIHSSLDKIRKLPIYMDVNFMSNDPIYIESTVNKFHRNFGIKNVYLDYVQIMADRDEQQTQGIGRLSRLMKLMSNELDICSVVLSQLNRNLESREDKRPLMSDFKMAGALEEDPDFAIGLYRDEIYNKDTKSKNLMEFIVLKHRNGPPGTVTVKFEGPTYRISEAK